jgi:hypothetical protein
MYFINGSKVDCKKSEWWCALHTDGRERFQDEETAENHERFLYWGAIKANSTVTGAFLPFVVVRIHCCVIIKSSSVNMFKEGAKYSLKLSSLQPRFLFSLCTSTSVSTSSHPYHPLDFYFHR